MVTATEAAEQVCRDLLDKAIEDGLVHRADCTPSEDPQLLTSRDLDGMVKLFMVSVRKLAGSIRKDKI